MNVRTLKIQVHLGPTLYGFAGGIPRSHVHIKIEWMVQQQSFKALSKEV